MRATCDVCGKPVTIFNPMVVKMIREGHPISHRRCRGGYNDSDEHDDWQPTRRKRPGRGRRQ